MIRSLPRQAFASLLVLSMLATSSPAQDTRVSAPKRLPPQVVFYVSVPDATELGKRFESSPFGQMVKDPAMADFIADVKAALASASKDSEAMGGINLQELMAIPNGNVTLAITAGGPKGIGYVLMVDFGKSRSTIDKLTAKAAEGLANQGAK
ncbi:MAG: hypothetical protein VYA62_04695, partial [Planctomycetota bacterium]|nr:hypothetical protein [Planctomycetota bacterium]